MTLLEYLEDILDDLRGPYGVTWVVDDHAIAQTEYRWNTVAKARRIAELGPWIVSDNGVKVDAMCEHYPKDEGIVIWGNIETPHDIVTDVRMTGGVWIYQ